MGAESFCLEAEGYSAEECYNRLVADAREEYGYGYYNGTISTCSELNFRGRNSKTFTKSELKKAYKTVEKEDGGRKWVAACIDCGIVSYTLRSVSRKATHKEPPKYAVKYVVGKQEFNTKKDADAYLKKALLDISCSRYGQVHKRRVLVSGTDVVTDMQVTEKTYKSRPHPKSMYGKVILEKHHYLFYGWAAC